MATRENESLKPRPSSDEHAKRRASSFASWMSKLAAAYRQEISIETQVMYLQLLSDLPLDRLNLAFEHAVRECKFMPTIAEIRDFEEEVIVEPERIAAAHERLRARLAAQPEVKMLGSVLDEPSMPRREITQLTTAEIEKRMDDLLKQREELLKPKVGMVER